MFNTGVTRMLRQSATTPRVKNRKENIPVCDALIKNGVEKWLANVIARRIQDASAIDAIYSPLLSRVSDPSTIPDMGKAVERIATAIKSREGLILAVDHDLDGVASAAVLWSALVKYFGVDEQRIEIVTSHRLTEGYGITLPVVQRIIVSSATLVISADKGSSDEPRIAMIASAGKDVIVTDHHRVPDDGPPRSAYAVVNPTRDGSEYDPHICGAAVAFLVMAKVRTSLLKSNYKRDIPSLVDLMDYVAVATVADCVSLRPDKSYANRAFIKRGLEILNESRRPCWEVFKATIESDVRTEHVGFQLAPPIAAAGRLDWADAGIRFLLARDIEDARVQWRVLQDENIKRKEIEKNLRKKAIDSAIGLQTQSIVLYFEDGHSGVHGITASRLAEMFGKPVGIFAPRGAGARNVNAESSNQNARSLASGSFRGIPGFNVHDALQHIHEMHPKLMIAFGGHEGAAGATVAIEEMKTFASAFEIATQAQLGTSPLYPVLWSDGTLDNGLISLDAYDKLMQLEPWGKDFPFPSFVGVFDLQSVTTIGDGTHLRLGLRASGRNFSGIWFNALVDRNSKLPFSPNTQVKLLFKLSVNRYHGDRNLQLQVIALLEDENSDE